MKKTVLASAVFLGVAGSASAQSITIQGTVDLGRGGTGTFGPITAPMTVTPPPGGGGGPPGGGGGPPAGGCANDGSAAASAGPPRFPHLLDGYMVRSSCYVAGVDYNVGLPAGTVLKDPLVNGALAPALVALGGRADIGSHAITFTGVNNAVIDGWDFSLEGGWQLSINQNNATIQNCNFKVGANKNRFILSDYGPNNLTVAYNNLDGGGVATAVSGQGLIATGAQGTTLLQYNYLHDAFYQLVNSSPSNVTGSVSNQVFKYNLLMNAGLGQGSGAHGDWVQNYSGSPLVYNNVDFEYNTFIQNSNIPGAATQGLSILSSNGQKASALSEKFSNNTFVTITNVNFPIIIDTTWLNGSAMVNDNYFDLTGVHISGGNWLFAGQYNPVDGPYHGTVTKSNNIDMMNGAVLQ